MITLAACFNYHIYTMHHKETIGIAHRLHHFLQRNALLIDVREPLLDTILAGLKRWTIYRKTNYIYFEREM